MDNEKVLDNQEVVEDAQNETLNGEVYNSEDEAIEAMVDNDQASKVGGLVAGALIVGAGAAAVVGAKKLISKIKTKKATAKEEETDSKEVLPEADYRKLTLKERLTGKIRVSSEEEEDE